MRKRVLFVLLVPVVLCLCTGITSTKIGEIQKNPRDYVGKEVVVSGEVTKAFSLLVIKHFALRDDSGEITIITDRPLPGEGQRLKVRGIVREAFAIGTESRLIIEERPETEK